MIRPLIFALLLLIANGQDTPKNAAGKKDDQLTVPCKSLRANPNYSKATWSFVASQTGVGWGITVNTTVLAHAAGLFELTPDLSKYDLIIKNINDLTAGTYECAGFIGDEKADVYHAFIMYIKDDIKIAETKYELDEYLGKDNKIAYCYVEYGAPYPPTVEVVVNNPSGTFSYEQTDDDLENNPFIAGSCALIPKTASFSCKVQFGQPPLTLIQDITYDNSAPSFSLTENGAPVNESNVPKWLSDRCKRFVKPADYDQIPKNTALDIGDSAKLNCGRVNGNDHNTGIWAFVAMDGTPGLIATNFSVTPGLGDLFEMPDNAFNLRIKSMKKELTGVFQCSGLKNDEIDIMHSAVVLTLKTPSCTTKTHPGLRNNERIGFCYSDYFGPYNPTVNFTRGSTALISATFKREAVAIGNELSVVGGCSLIVDNYDFKCEAKFGPPSGPLVEDLNLDRSAPEKITSCNSGPTNDPPSWLEEECIKLLRLDTSTTKKPAVTTVKPVETTKPNVQSTAASGAPKLLSSSLLLAFILISMYFC